MHAEVQTCPCNGYSPREKEDGKHTAAHQKHKEHSHGEGVAGVGGEEAEAFCRITVHQRYAVCQRRVERWAQTTDQWFHQTTVYTVGKQHTRSHSSHNEKDAAPLFVVLHYEIEQGYIHGNPRKTRCEHEYYVVEECTVAAVECQQQGFVVFDDSEQIHCIFGFYISSNWFAGIQPVDWSGRRMPFQSSILLSTISTFVPSCSVMAFSPFASGVAFTVAMEATIMA